MAASGSSVYTADTHHHKTFNSNETSNHDICSRHWCKVLPEAEAIEIFVCACSDYNKSSVVSTVDEPALFINMTGMLPLGEHGINILGLANQHGLLQRCGLSLWLGTGHLSWVDH